MDKNGRVVDIDMGEIKEKKIEKNRMRGGIDSRKVSMKSSNDRHERGWMDRMKSEQG